MEPIEIFAQALGIVGLVCNVLSFQCKDNKHLLLMQSMGGAFFFFNFLLIGAYGGAMFNLVCVLRGLLLYKNARRPWKLVLTELAFVGCFGFSVFLNSAPLQILLAALPCLALMLVTFLMYRGETMRIRYVQICFHSPAWLVHNSINFSLGGILCECFVMISSAIFLLRMRKSKAKQ